MNRVDRQLARARFVLLTAALSVFSGCCCPNARGGGDLQEGNVLQSGKPGPVLGVGSTIDFTFVDDVDVIVVGAVAYAQGKQNGRFVAVIDPGIRNAPFGHWVIDEWSNRAVMTRASKYFWQLGLELGVEAVVVPQSFLDLIADRGMFGRKPTPFVKRLTIQRIEDGRSIAGGPIQVAVLQVVDDK
jgi:hypothetical protein